MSVIKYQRALVGIGALLRDMRLKDLKHRRKEGSLTASEHKSLSNEVKGGGGVLTAADLEVLSARFTADAREAIAAGIHDAPEVWDE